MIWQDLVISIASATFAIALIPQVVYGFKAKQGPMKLITAIPTFLGLFAIAYSVWTLGLIFSAVTTTITGVMWLLLAIQSFMYRMRYNRNT